MNQLEWTLLSDDGTSTSEYLHFNWGWNGDCNGFFYSNVFSPDLGDSYDDEAGNNGYDYDFGDIVYFTVEQ